MRHIRKFALLAVTVLVVVGSIGSPRDESQKRRQGCRRYQGRRRGVTACDKPHEVTGERKGASGLELEFDDFDGFGGRGFEGGFFGGAFGFGG